MILLRKASSKELQNLNKEQGPQVKRLISKKNQHNHTIPNAQSTSNELKQQVSSPKRINLVRDKYSFFKKITNLKETRIVKKYQRKYKSNITFK